MVLPLVLLLAGAFNEKLVRGGFRGPGLILGLFFALGAVFTLRPRRVVVANGELELHGALGTTRVPVASVREVSVSATTAGRGGTS